MKDARNAASAWAAGVPESDLPLGDCTIFLTLTTELQSTDVLGFPMVAMRLAASGIDGAVYV